MAHSKLQINSRSSRRIYWLIFFSILCIAFAKKITNTHQSHIKHAERHIFTNIITKIASW